MEVGTQIKKYRIGMNLSQEELADKVYVSRQTVSNWETGKNYPDIHSLLLLGALFNVSLDQLVKGDVIAMKERIKETEIKKFNKLKCPSEDASVTLGREKKVITREEGGREGPGRESGQGDRE